MNEGWSAGSPSGERQGLLGLEPRHIAAIVVALILAATIIVAVLLLRSPAEPEPEPDLFAPNPAEIACLEGGGTWFPPGIGEFTGHCVH